MLADLEIWFGWCVKIFMCLGGVLLLALIATGFWCIWKIVTTTLYTMALAVKWNRFNALSDQAKKEALKSKKFPKDVFSDE